MTAPLDGRHVPTSRLIRAPSWRAVAHDLLNRPSSPAARNLHLATMLVILLSSLVFVLQSEPTLASWGGWAVLDALFAILFTGEYLLRLLVAPDGQGDEADEQDAAAAAAAGQHARWYASPAATPLQARVRCALEPLVLVDLAAILPFWLELFSSSCPTPFSRPSACCGWSGSCACCGWHRSRRSSARSPSASAAVCPRCVCSSSSSCCRCASSTRALP